MRNLAGKTTSYGYDTQGRLTWETNPLSKQVMRLAYDPATGRVSDEWDALDHHTVFAWDPATERATMTDPRGGAWVDDYENGVIARRIDPVGRTTRYGYDTQLRLTSVENPNGNLSHYSYNTVRRHDRRPHPVRASHHRLQQPPRPDPRGERAGGGHRLRLRRQRQPPVGHSNHPDQ